MKELTKEERREIVDKFFHYSALAINEAMKLEALEAYKSKRKKCSNISDGPVAKRRERRYKK